MEEMELVPGEDQTVRREKLERIKEFVGRDSTKKKSLRNQLKQLIEALTKRPLK